MTVSNRLARPMLAPMFVVGGLDAVRHPGSKVKSAEAVIGPLTSRYPALNADPETFVRLNGAIQVGAGLLLATGRMRRLAALTLAASLLPTTYAGHRFWEEDDEQTRAQQRVHFLKNLGLLGGLLLAAGDTNGAPSISWRARRRASHLGDVLSGGRDSSARPGRALKRKVTSAPAAVRVLLHEGVDFGAGAAQWAEARAHDATEVGGRVRDVAVQTGDRARGAAVDAGGRTRRAAMRASRRTHDLAEHANMRSHDLAVKTNERTNELASRAAERAQDVAVRAQSVAAQTNRRAHEVAGAAASRSTDVASLASDRAHEVASRANRLATRVGRVGAEYASDAADYLHTGAAHADEAAAKLHDRLPF